jgi:FKBP-type peptidyl-prolyl cis-trans isomerase FkpA
MTRSLPLCALFATVAACSANGGGGAKADLSSEDAKTHYALGFTVGTNLSHGKAFTSDEAADIAAGMNDSLVARPAQIDMATYGPKVQQMMMARNGAPGPGAQAASPEKVQEEKKKGEEFAAGVAKEPGAEKLPSGLVFKSLTPGSGANPVATDVVTVNYEGKLTDGTVFDASSKHPGGSATFPLEHVIPCWTEGVQKLKVGGKAELVCPAAIAYGDQGRPPTIPGGATLVFTVELLGINGGGTKPPQGPPGHPVLNTVTGPDGKPALQIRPPPLPQGQAPKAQ